uniref:Holo-[acyl-carrier-protein] synthase n=1 Tax=uncultured Helicobacter sp. TaxID=175537 RepID=A0A650EK02_9HELI|nr:holo-[acyl-carrier-protein] synthase [uncultured Helicobacter sp.]
MIGIDIVQIARMERLIKRFGERGLHRFLSLDEIALCMRYPEDAQTYRTYQNSHNENLQSHAVLSPTFIDSLFHTDRINVARVAGFWAAKEAFSKALGVGIGYELGFLDMIVTKDSKNAPHITLTKSKQTYFKIKQSALSITHDGGFVIAAVICL